MPNEDRLKALLSDLGRSTLRGVRKCPKCGTLNGIRGIMCKNKACDQVFKEAGDKRKNTTEVCKLITGTTTQVFSVRVRDKGPDYRGFVQLPLVSNSLCTRPTDTLINEPSAVCFVENCQRIFNTNILKCHERELQPVTACQHIQAATRCFASALPLIINNAVLFSLNIPAYIKQSIWQLTVVALGPLVQRVSKTIMVVKCKVTSKHPLGFLHVTFSPAKSKDCQSHFFCSCPTFKGQGSRNRSDDVIHDRRCLHYYACVAAFAGDEKLSEEFAAFVDQERSQEIVLNLQEQLSGGDSEGENPSRHVVAVLGNPESNLQVEVEVLRDDAVMFQQFIMASQPVSEDISQVGEFETISETDVPDVCLQGLEVMPDLSSPDLLSSIKNDPLPKTFLRINGLKRKKDNSSPSISGLSEPKKSRKKIPPKPEPNQVKDESTVNQTFIQWLATVTERINQQMHYQFNGKPAPLVFHTPQEFFDCLRERISYGGKKRRLPNTTTAFVRKHAVPLGTFTKYTWHINNIIHCKQIFETPLMPLEITRSFVENQDGTYDVYEASNLKDEAYSKMDNAPRIKPMELKTFLKVGNTAPDQKVPTPMIIEWIPDILPKTKVGELKITFEFGHRRP
uniref:SWIM-type domain-containing protein n=1 Tax=Homalodisca liturata TaxID=320908 RepID=A0A1B6HG95_9HEMI